MIKISPEKSGEIFCLLKFVVPKKLILRIINIFFFLTLLFSSIQVRAQQPYITVDTSTYTPEQLVRDIFIGSQNASCITVSNITAKGWPDFVSGKPASYGYFEKGTLPFEIEKGIILSTGSAAKAPGPNNSLLDDGDNTIWLGDPDIGNSYVNATTLEFDFVAHQSTGISFEYIFLSEEYQASNCRYSDAFKFLIKKAGSSDEYVNIALVPGTTDAVSSLSINGARGCEKNIDYFGGFNTDTSNSPTNFNGQTKILTAKKDNIVAGEKYHIKLVIADHLNYRYDSAVLLKAGSFVGKKDLGQDLLISNGHPLCEGDNKILDATTPGATSYQWFKNGVTLTGETNPKLTVPGTVTSNGEYEVEIILGGCLLKGTIRIEVEEKPIVPHGNFTHPLCDNKLDGNVPVDFDQVSRQIISNFNNSYLPKYYLNPIDAQNPTATPLANEWILTAPTKLYMRIESTFGCAPVFGEVTLTIGNKIPLIKNTFSKDFCDNGRVGEVSFNLDDYIREFHSTIQPTFFNSLADAKNNINPISSNQTMSDTTKIFGLRFENSALGCPNVASITINKKTPNESTSLHDKSICPGTTTTLDAGSGFDYYKWSNGIEGVSASSISNVGIGDYSVELTSNGCTYTQHVKITEAQLPKIDQIDVTGNTATVFASGGIPPYRYSWDGINFYDSNVLTNIPRGKRNIYLKDSQDCTSVTREFLILNLINVITPNGDGKNDVLDYSDLVMKKDVTLDIFDRFGNAVFKSQDSHYIWDGSSNGKIVPTGTYWYVLNWTEPDTNKPVSYKGWILVKHRD